MSGKTPARGGGGGGGGNGSRGVQVDEKIEARGSNYYYYLPRTF